MEPAGQKREKPTAACTLSVLTSAAKLAPYYMGKYKAILYAASHASRVR